MFFQLLGAASDFLWTYIVIAMLAGCALYFTVRLGGVQFTGIGEMLRNLFSDTTPAAPAQGGVAVRRISSFQAFTVSLASRVGTGNLAGVASAIFVGGPGAVFWMWVMALLGAATAFMEATLAQLFKRRGADSFYGGPAYYMQHGLGSRRMGVAFAVLIIFGFAVANQLVQSNTLCDALAGAAGGGKVAVGVGLGLLTLLIIFGGIQRIARFTAVVVPFMALGYIVLALVVVAINWQRVPEMLRLIVESAFGWGPAAGGAVGVAVMQGVRRGLFSNEAGEGSAPNAAATAHISHPVKQGLLQSFGVFADTIVICTCTAFVVLLSGLWADGEDGVALTASAMRHHLGAGGGWFLTAAITLFAYSTIIGNYFYGEANLRFITRSPRALTAFRLLTGAVVAVAGFLTLQQAWTVVDFAMALMTMLNLYAVARLSRYAFALLADYKRQRRAGRDPVFHKEMFPEADLEGWDDNAGTPSDK